MNEIILDLAAVYTNQYRTKCEQLGQPVDKALLRKHVADRFGATYAAILVP
jgi:hypothetical protein